MTWEDIKLNRATRARKPNTDVACRGKVIAVALLVVEGAMIVEQGRGCSRPASHKGERRSTQALVAAQAAVPVSWNRRERGCDETLLQAMRDGSVKHTCIHATLLARPHGLDTMERSATCVAGSP